MMYVTKCLGSRQKMSVEDIRIFLDGRVESLERIKLEIGLKEEPCTAVSIVDQMREMTKRIIQNGL